MVNYTNPDEPFLLEPEFVGEHRKKLVDGLLSVYDEVNQKQSARWVSLEAPSGWGKTRVVREFYARLASDRQHEPAYWPATILESLSEPQNDVSARRKQIAPKFTHHVEGSLPAFFWWGIAASKRNGVAADALAQDLRQLRAHECYLDDAWRKLSSWSERNQGWWKPKSEVIWEGAVTHLAGVALHQLIGATIPGIGLVWSYLERFDQKIVERNERQERLDDTSEIEVAPFDEVDLIVNLLTKLARPGLPVVIVVEDYHTADAALAELLARCALSQASILIITTSWAGYEQGERHLEEAFHRASDRLWRLDHTTETFPAHFPQDASLAQLDSVALASIIRFYYPYAATSTVDALIDRYGSPLALELFCMIDAYHDNFPDGDLHLDTKDIDKLPENIRDVYRRIWAQLPKSVRKSLTYASMGVSVTDNSVDSELELTWHNPLLIDVINNLDSPDTPDVVGALKDPAGSISWTRWLSQSLRSFQERTQWEIALDDDQLLLNTDREAFFSSAAAILSDTLKTDEAASTFSIASDHLYRARLAIVLHNKNMLHVDAMVKASIRALDAMAHSPRNLPSRIKLGTLVLAELETGEHLWSLIGSRHARNLLESGDNAAAITLYEQLVANREEVLGVEHPDTLSSGNNLALAYRAKGRVDEAIQLHESVTADLERALGADHPDTLSSRNNLAFAYRLVGRVDKAIALYEHVLAARERVLEANHPDTLSSGNNLATAVLSVGQVDRAVALHQHVLAARERALSTDDPAVLESRNNLAEGYLASRQVHQAVALFERVADDAQRVMGTDHPTTLASRNNLAFACRVAGKIDEAIQLHENVIADLERVLGPDHPDTLSSRNNLAEAYLAAHRIHEALALHQEILAARQQVLGPEHPATLASRHNLATTVLADGRIREAVTLYEQVVVDTKRVMGQGHPDTLKSRNNLAAAYLAADRIPQALALHQEVLAARQQVLGPGHPATLESRNNLAKAYLTAGQTREAITLYERLVDDSQRLMGQDHPDTLAYRNNLAHTYLTVGQIDQAAALYRYGKQI